MARLEILEISILLDYLVGMITTITGKNQVPIPAKIARELELRTGHRLDWHVSPDGSLVARSLPSKAELSRRLHARGRRYLSGGDDPIRDLIRERVNDEQQQGVCRP